MTNDETEMIFVRVEIRLFNAFDEKTNILDEQLNEIYEFGQTKSHILGNLFPSYNVVTHTVSLSPFLYMLTRQYYNSFLHRCSMSK